MIMIIFFLLLQRTGGGWPRRYPSEHVQTGWTAGYTRENGALVEVQGVPDSRMGVFVNDCWKHLLGGGQGGVEGGCRRWFFKKLILPKPIWDVEH